MVILQFLVAMHVSTWVARLNDIKGQDAHDGKGHGDKAKDKPEGIAKWEKAFDHAANKAYYDCCVEDKSSTLCKWIDEHTSGGCEGNYTEFRHQLADAIENRIRPIGVLAIVFAVIEVICPFTSCGLIWKRPRDARAEEGVEGAYSMHPTTYVA